MDNKTLFITTTNTGITHLTPVGIRYYLAKETLMLFFLINNILFNPL